MISSKANASYGECATKINYYPIPAVDELNVTEEQKKKVSFVTYMTFE